MNTDFTIRIAQPADVLELKDLFQDTVLNINRRDYSKAEVEDWASCGNDISHIKEMIRTYFFIVATNQQLQVVGFASITQQGYLHSMFVHKDFQGKGIATILLNKIERYATATGIIRITSEVSLTARTKGVYSNGRTKTESKSAFSHQFLDGKESEQMK